MKALAASLCLLAVCLLNAESGRAAYDPNRWLMGFGKALFWMSETELRFFYPIADSYNESEDDPDAGLRLISGEPAVLRETAFDLSFTMKGGKLYRITLERAVAEDPARCGTLFRQVQERLRKLHDPAIEEETWADSQAPRASFLFNGGGRIDLAGGWTQAQCNLRLDLTRAAPGSL